MRQWGSGGALRMAARAAPRRLGRALQAGENVDALRNTGANAPTPRRRSAALPAGGQVAGGMIACEIPARVKQIGGLDSSSPSLIVES